MPSVYTRVLYICDPITTAPAPFVTSNFPPQPISRTPYDLFFPNGLGPSSCFSHLTFLDCAYTLHSRNSMR
ncbi:hypothetical protein LMH87_007435 [Akanthomyces muscarius]|uniref:Uncharacterized protein n=1 Tax=Akanthomyces muscarius TaxID=2231603 RepID=A0A9W8QSX7_AKAMU|nr:hypothetical protein LMH87_007435 [Akanthomyces muscarius]KAJ4165822.1 hypothetical protein LMH87_007435 [Akanthomyces muscarius]